MSNPYASPSVSADGAVANRTQLPRKPLRVWIFQALLLLHLAGAVAVTVAALQFSEVRELPPSAILSGLIRSIVGIPVVAVLVLALQRWVPKSSVVAPALASLWWVLSLSAHFALAGSAEPAAVRAWTFEDAPHPPPWATGLFLHAILLWFVVSTWSHRATRAYLARESPPKS